jgi:hypothetical protein
MNIEFDSNRKKQTIPKIPIIKNKFKLKDCNDIEKENTKKLQKQADINWEKINKK